MKNKKTIFIIAIVVALIGLLGIVFYNYNNNSINIKPGEGAGKEYKSLDLKQTLRDDDIEITFSDYKVTDDQITIYLFRGKGCGFCNEFLKFLNSITGEYGKYFRLVSYEVWGDAKNAELLDEVAAFSGQDGGGVPFIIIGDQFFPGYVSDFDEDIKTAIMNLYESEEKYDVFVEMAKAKVQQAKSGFFTSNKAIIVWNLIFVTLGTCAIMCFINFQNKKLITRFDELEKCIKVFTDEKLNTKEKTKKNNMKI